MILEDPGAFAVLGGDLTETITKMCVADPAEQFLDNTEQVSDVVKVLLPIAHKILGSTWGNHDGGRLEKAGQFDPGRIIAQMLCVPYFRVRSIIDLEFRGVIKRISLVHKYRRAFSIAAIESEVKKIQAYSPFVVNCYFSGHNHKSFILPQESLSLISGKGFETNRWYIANAGSFTIRTGSYVEKDGYAPTPQDVVYYTFDDQGNDVCDSIPIKSI